jgi:hypothetical protein
VPDPELSAEYLLMHALNLPPTTPRAALFQYKGEGEMERNEKGETVLSEGRYNTS